MQARSEVKFKVGDKAVYPAQGVAEVISIEEKDIAGSRQRFYVLRIMDTDRKIMVPVNNAGAVGLRQVISEQEIREIFDILRERTIAFDNQTWNRRYRGFMDKIKTGSIYDVAEVLRDLYRLKTDKQLSFGERAHARYRSVPHRQRDRHLAQSDRRRCAHGNRSHLPRELALTTRRHPDAAPPAATPAVPSLSSIRPPRAPPARVPARSPAPLPLLPRPPCRPLSVREAASAQTVSKTSTVRSSAPVPSCGPSQQMPCALAPPDSPLR